MCRNFSIFLICKLLNRCSTLGCHSANRRLFRNSGLPGFSPKVLACYRLKKLPVWCQPRSLLQLGCRHPRPDLLLLWRTIWEAKECEERKPIIWHQQFHIVNALLMFHFFLDYRRFNVIFPKELSGIEASGPGRSWACTSCQPCSGSCSANSVSLPGNS